MPTSAIINIVRIVFVITSVLIGLSMALGSKDSVEASWPWIGALAGLAFGGFFVMVDMLLKKFTIRSFSSGTIGLLIGVLCAWLITQIPGLPLVDGHDD